MAKRKVKKIYRCPRKADWVQQPLAIAGGLVGLAIGVQAIKLLQKQEGRKNKMPIVNGVHYAYTPSGLAAAKRARKKKTKGFHWANVHVREVQPIWFD